MPEPNDCFNGTGKHSVDNKNNYCCEVHIKQHFPNSSSLFINIAFLADNKNWSEVYIEQQFSP